MSLLKQIDDKGAVVEWSPIASNANIVALGTKVRFRCLQSAEVIANSNCVSILQGFGWLWV